MRPGGFLGCCECRPGGAHTLAVPESGHGPEAMVGVYDLSSRIVHDLMSGQPGLGKPPGNEEEFRSMPEKMLDSDAIRARLGAG
ncbi:MAG: hypothetical protein DIJKHBIC_02568 [Thermoanaerobaculia bacterium]|nr:hypothetical protein [Thermoanaerobaculia bacterium]